MNGELPSNYHLTYSLNEDNRENAFDILSRGGNISAVFRKELPKKYNGFKFSFLQDIGTTIKSSFNSLKHGLRFFGAVKESVGNPI